MMMYFLYYTYIRNGDAVLYIRFGVTMRVGGVDGVDIIIYIHTIDCGGISLLPMMNRELVYRDARTNFHSLLTRYGLIFP